ncbi:MAG: flagellar hook-length control protein FliK [Vulcanimicrobiaceae bacterium]
MNLPILSILNAIGGGAEPSGQPNKGILGSLGSDALRFGKVLAASLDSKAPSATVVGVLGGLVNHGLPIQTVVQQVAKSVLSYLASHGDVPGSASAPSTQSSANLLGVLEQALSPPSHGPPGHGPPIDAFTVSDGVGKVGAIAARLTAILAAIAPGTQAGQQSDISGQILDAVTAKELPAPSTDPTAKPSGDVAGMVNALLQAVTDGFTPGTPVKLPTPPDRPIAGSGVDRLPSFPSAEPPMAPTHLPILAPTSNGGILPPFPSAEPPMAPTHPPILAPASTYGSAPAPLQGSTRTAPDLLSRMLGRAAQVDAQVNGTSAPAAQNEAAASLDAASGIIQGTPQGAMPGQPSSAMLASLALFEHAAMTLSQNGTDPQGQNSTSSGGHESLGGNGSSTLGLFGPSSAGSMGFGGLVSNALATSLPSTAPAPLPYAGPGSQEILSQVIKGMNLRTVNGTTQEVRLRLVPEHLGDVAIKLTLNGSNVSASMVTQNGDVRNALLAQQHHLARAFAAAGMKLTGFSVNVSGGNQEHANQQHGGRGMGRRYVIHELSGDALASQSLTDLAPPLLSGATPGLLNCLV